MRVVIGNNPAADSNDVPIMLKLSPEDVKRIASKPENHSIVVFHPHHWTENHSRRWANAKLSVINGEISVFTMDPGDHGSDSENADIDVSNLALDPKQVTEVAKSSGPLPMKAPESAESSQPDTPEIRDETMATDDDILNILGLGGANDTNAGRASVDIDVNIS